MAAPVLLRAVLLAQAGSWTSAPPRAASLALHTQNPRGQARAAGREQAWQHRQQPSPLSLGRVLCWFP